MTIKGSCRSVFPGLAIFLTWVVFGVSAVYAADRDFQLEAPPSLAVAITIDSENLIELYRSVPALKIIDSRHREDFRDGYIETSHSLPLQDTDCRSLSKLAKNTDQAMVFYCNGSLADASIKAIEVASSCGYKRLFWFRGGFVEWTDKDYPYRIE